MLLPRPKPVAWTNKLHSPSAHWVERRRLMTDPLKTLAPIPFVPIFSQAAKWNVFTLPNIRMRSFRLNMLLSSTWEVMVQCGTVSSVHAGSFNRPDWPAVAISPLFRDRDTPDNAVIQQVCTQIYENGGVVAAVCHGPCGIVNVKLSNGKYLIDGKEVTGFSNAEEEAVGLTQVMPFLLEDKMKQRGARYHAAANWASNVVVCDRVVTGQNPASATPVGEAIVKLLSL
jgi:hypothetical protein